MFIHQLSELNSEDYVILTAAMTIQQQVHRMDEYFYYLIAATYPQIVCSQTKDWLATLPH